MSEKEKKEDGGEKKDKPKKSGTSRLMGLFTLILALIFIPTTIVLFVGMLPTMAAMLSMGRGKRTKALTVGAMNLAGCIPFLLDLWTSDHSVQHAFYIISNPKTEVVIYCAATIGYVIDWAMAGIVKTIMVQRAQSNLKDVKRQQADLVTRWGDEVRGNIPLDADGFRLESKVAAGAADESD